MTASQLFKTTRATHQLSLREFGAALGISHTQVKQIEDGHDLPTRRNMADWIASDEAWVRVLGLELFGAQFAPVIDGVLTPEVAA